MAVPRALIAVLLLMLSMTLLSPVIDDSSARGPSVAAESRGILRGSSSDNRAALITEVYYNTLVANEYVVVGNPGMADIDISNWTLSDGEGTLLFPEGVKLASGGRIVVTQNSSLYYRDTLTPANLTYGGGDAKPMVAGGGRFQLNNEGDEVKLADETDSLLDILVYGASHYSGTGWEGVPAAVLAKGRVAHRASYAGAYSDTNTSSDWDGLRTYTIGQSSHFPREFAFDGTGRGVLSPDSSHEAISTVIDSARSSLYLSSYTFTNPVLAERLVAAAKRGIDVRVLTEGSPVAGMQESEFEFLTAIREAGASVRLLLGNASLGVVQRYRYNHAKYMVVDNTTVVVGSENWGEFGFPAAGKSGNRGWSVILEDFDLAEFLGGVFLEDWDPRRADSVDIRDSGVDPSADQEEDPAGDYAHLMIQQAFHGHFRVTPVIGPDNTLASETVLGLIRSAKSRLYIEQFLISKTWGQFANLYLEEGIAAARRGVDVRVLLDPSWYNVDSDDDTDNDDTIAHLIEVAQLEHVTLQAKLGDSQSHDLVKFHNKGVVVDGEKVLVSSINWNLNSVTRNREVGLILENAELARFFETAFLQDWKDDITPPKADAGEDVAALDGTEVCLSGAGSTDDVGIASYLWDVGADGTYDVGGMVACRRFNRPGTYAVVLHVEDSWGNVGEDVLSVMVSPRSEVAMKDVDQPPVLPPFALVMSTILSILFFAILQRKAVNIEERL